MASRSFRKLNRSEKAFIGDVLRGLREHFHEWSNREVEGGEHGLMEFAFYEGCGDSRHCGKVLAEAAPFALGGELVDKHGFQWVMLPAGGTPRYGVIHPALSEPIDLGSLEDGSWNDKEYDQATPARGERTIDSLETIMERVRRLSENA